MMLLKEILNKNNKIYDDYYSDGYIDGWEDIDKKHNFHYLFKIEKYCKCLLDNCSVLDMGCGTGDILKYLPENCDYLGIDIYKPALNLAKIKFPDYKLRFKYRNILTFRSKSKFDFVICSGALTVNHGNNYEFLNKAVKNMWRLCKKGVTFNILSNEKEDDELFYYDIDEVKNICLKIINKKGTYNSKFNPIDK